MLYDQYQPYYAVFSDPEFTASEVMQEQEWEQMRTYYSGFCTAVFQKILDRCETLDYEGSRIFDETPDQEALRKLTEEISEQVKESMDTLPGLELTAQARSENLLEDLVQVLLLQEIARRRCRNKRQCHQEQHRPPHRGPRRNA